MAIGYFLKFRGFLFATFFLNRTAGMEGASRGRVGGAGDISLNEGSLFFLSAGKNRDRIQQSLGVWVLRIGI